MEVPINLMNDIINYLARQPYKDVTGLIGEIIKLQSREQETNQKELPLI
jgi:hypothetical protein|tara:strand:- start:428 stop:574 length:147 start_codon:yes stop_codon:yes gene_type:complete